MMGLKVLFILTFLTIAQCTLTPLNCETVRAFVDGHNHRRSLLAEGKVPGQPPASEMKVMVWDEELAAKAAQWAAANRNYQNPDHYIDSGRFSTGENVYSYSTTDRTYELNPDAVLEAWFSEHVNYAFGPIQNSDFDDNSNNYNIGLYTQMVWSDSIYFGCGISETFENGLKSFVVVCNYGPGGNYIGETPYKAGSPSTELLCVTDDCDHPYGILCHDLKHT